MKKLNLLNKRFERLKVIEEKGSDRNNKTMWLVRCDCGNKRIVRGSDLVSKKILSCGCYNVEINTKLKTKHGMSNTSFYKKWNSLLTRCYNKNQKGYKYWGGKKIICEWNNFAEFKKDMYGSYIKHCKTFGKKQTTIDRKNGNKNYCKNNCRWATYTEQNNNKVKYSFINL